MTHQNRPQPRNYYSGEDFGQSITADELIDEQPSDRIDTGLLDARGRPITRQRERVKFGFTP
jgi:hypothetical protein